MPLLALSLAHTCQRWHSVHSSGAAMAERLRAEAGICQNLALLRMACHR